MAKIIVLEGLDATGKELHKNVISFLLEKNSIILKPPYPGTNSLVNPSITRRIFKDFTYPFYKNLCNLIKNNKSSTYIFDRFLFTIFAYESANYNFFDIEDSLIELFELYNNSFGKIKVIYLKPSLNKEYFKKLRKKESIFFSKDYYKKILDGYDKCIEMCKEKFPNFDILTCNI